MTRDLDELDLAAIRASLHAAMIDVDPHKALASWAMKHGEDLCANLFEALSPYFYSEEHT